MLQKSKRQIKGIIDDWDTNEWRRKMVTKKTLSLYRTRKRKIEEETWFYNAKKCNIMMKARSDTLRIGWREFGTEEEKICKLCKKEEETLEHFIMDCDELQECRKKFIELQRPSIENKKDIMAKVLMMEGVEDRYLDIMDDLWKEREAKMKQI